MAKPLEDYWFHWWIASHTAPCATFSWRVPSW